jgi:drug/metabolite transporter (DMT)-like permease
VTWTPVLVVVALVAFAANSLLCRLALGGGLADPMSFTVLRLTSGVLVLLPVARWSGESAATWSAGTWVSGLALFVWYRALRSLTATSAAIAQLLVPVIAAFGGVLLLGETITARLVLASALILGGVATALTASRKRRP